MSHIYLDYLLLTSFWTEFSFWEGNLESKFLPTAPRSEAGLYCCPDQLRSTYFELNAKFIHDIFVSFSNKIHLDSRIKLMLHFSFTFWILGWMIFKKVKNKLLFIFSILLHFFSIKSPPHAWYLFLVAFDHLRFFCFHYSWFLLFYDSSTTKNETQLEYNVLKSLKISILHWVLSYEWKFISAYIFLLLLYIYSYGACAFVENICVCV